MFELPLRKYLHEIRQAEAVASMARARGYPATAEAQRDGALIEFIEAIERLGGDQQDAREALAGAGIFHP